MPKAIESHTTTRRALFSAAAALPLTALPAVALAAENPDTELLEAHRVLLRQTDLIQAMSDEPALPPGPECDAEEDRFEAAVSVTDDMFDKFIDTPARTPAGRRAKADALRLAFTRTICRGVNPTIDTIDEDGEWQERLAWSLARDVLGEG